MAQFDPLAPRVRDQKDEKQVAAMFFAEKYLDQLQEKKANLFFDFGQDRLPSEARALPFHPRTGTKRIILRSIERNQRFIDEFEQGMDIR